MFNFDFILILPCLAVLQVFVNFWRNKKCFMCDERTTCKKKKWDKSKNQGDSDEFVSHFDGIPSEKLVSSTLIKCDTYNAFDCNFVAQNINVLHIQNLT